MTLHFTPALNHVSRCTPPVEHAGISTHPFSEGQTSVKGFICHLPAAEVPHSWRELLRLAWLLLVSRDGCGVGAVWQRGSEGQAVGDSGVGGGGGAVPSPRQQTASLSCDSTASSRSNFLTDRCPVYGVPGEISSCNSPAGPFDFLWHFIFWVFFPV